MSVAAEILKLPLLRVARSRVHRRAARVIEVPSRAPALNPPLEPLIRQVFLHENAPRCVAFAAAGPETNVGALVEAAGQTLATISGACVAVVTAQTGSFPSDSRDERQSWEHDDFWRAHASQITDRLWQIDPQAILSASASRSSRRGGIADTLPFEFVLVATSANSRTFRALCSFCDAGLLVLSANRTRKETALQAARLLRSANIELLGAVLDGRTFPIPESIYRRL